ncbi:hypothetical protein CPB97_009722 [Podila verticillata]|nr:hypothetical protein CPB97_009722 [Podila verticillata]
MQKNPAKDLLEAIDKASEDLRKLSLTIHDNPEVGYQETLAHKTLTDYLIKQGFHVTKHACGIETAFIAEYVQLGGEHQHQSKELDNSAPLPSVGFCSEFDALPEPVGHGCGHNLIAIAGVAAALGVKRALEKNRIRGKVRLLGTPAEETLGGKRPMLERGAFKGLDACLMVHPGPVDILYRTGLAVGRLEIAFHGKAAHASASPWEGINALDAYCMAYNAIGVLRQQTLPSNRIHSIITNGGQAANIIPDLVTGVVMYRATKKEDFEKLHDQLVEILESAAETTGCTVTIEKVMEYQPLNNNALLTDRFGSHMESFGAHYMGRQVDETYPTGSTDMGNVTVAMPGFHPVFNITSLKGEREPGLSTHSILFAERARSETAHKTAIRAGKAMSLTGLDVILDAEFTKNVRKEFDASQQK